MFEKGMYGAIALAILILSLLLVINNNLIHALFLLSFTLIYFNDLSLFLEYYFYKKYLNIVENDVHYMPVTFPNVTAVVFAYLPNEKDIIIDTISYFLNSIKYPGGYNVILAYNSTEKMPIIDKLEEISTKYNNFKLLDVPNSCRKATNIKAVLEIINTHIVGFFDADSRPESTCFTKAMYWFEKGFDFVQGSNWIKNYKQNFITSIVSVEFLLKYMVSYTARYYGFEITYFSGSNGYWKTSMAKKISANEIAQVEDIDMAVRAVIKGAKLAYDPKIKCYEEAPANLLSWWRQRIRWSEGWSQLLKWHQTKILNEEKIQTRNKIIWTFFLFYRRLVIPIAVLLIMLTTTFHIFFEITFSPAEYFIVIVRVVLQIIITLLMTMRLIKIDEIELITEKYRKYFLMYILIFPLYDFIRTLCIFFGSRALIYEPKKWHCTTRARETLVKG